MKKWPTKTLGELCDVRIGRTPRRDTPGYWGGKTVWVSISELTGGLIESSKENISDLAVAECMGPPIPVGTLLFSFKLSIGKMGVAGVPLFTNEAIAALPIREPSVLSRDYLRYALMAVSHEGAANVAVLGRVLNKQKVCDIRVPVPPLREQERIVRLLDEADELRRLRAQADKRMADFIPALFHKRFGDPITNPKGWPVKRLGEVTTIAGGGTPSKAEASFWGGDIVWVTPSDLPPRDSGPIGIDASRSRITNAGLRSSSATLLPRGTVLFSSRATIGKVAIASTALTTNQGFVSLTPAPTTSSVFLAHLLFACREAISRLSASTTFREVSRSAVREFAAPIPPLPEQKRFSRIVSDWETMQASSVASGRRADALFDSMLHRAFVGEL